MERNNTNLPDPELLLRYLRGELPDAEKTAVERMAAADPRLSDILGDMRRAEALSQDLVRMELLDAEAGFGRVQSRIRARARERVFRRAVRWAAVLMLPLLVSSLVFGWLYYRERMPEELFAEVATPAGTVIRYDLPDGSVVWLNAGSRLRYPVRFAGGKREVELRGEAYFEVEADRKSPFYVHTDAGMSVHVYGTSFNVNAYDDEPAIRTVLEKGRVNVVAPDRTTVRIEPGEQVVFDRRTGALTCSQVRVEDECAWRDGRLVFRNTPLDEVLHRLARHYNVDIEFRNHSDEVFRYRATFRDETLTQIFDYLSASADIRWRVVAPERRDGDSYTRRRILVEQF